ECRQRCGRALEIVVSHHVPELVRALELLAGEGDALADLPRALSRPLAEPALKLVDVGGDEDGDAAIDVPLDLECALELELEDADGAVLRDPVDLRAERAVPLARDVWHPLGKLAGVDAPRELVVREEPVVASVDLTGPLWPRRRRDRDLEAVHALQQALD